MKSKNSVIQNIITSFILNPTQLSTETNSFTSLLSIFIKPYLIYKYPNVNNFLEYVQSLHPGINQVYSNSRNSMLLHRCLEVQLLLILTNGEIVTLPFFQTNRQNQMQTLKSTDGIDSRDWVADILDSKKKERLQPTAYIKRSVQHISNYTI